MVASYIVLDICQGGDTMQIQQMRRTMMTYQTTRQQIDSMKAARQVPVTETELAIWKRAEERRIRNGSTPPGERR
jgi:hypothetical protein